MLADACAPIRLPASQASHHLHLPASTRVLISLGSGWLSVPEGPEGAYTVHGGTSTSALGMLQGYIVVPAAEVELAPDHLSNAEAAALPLTGLTAWRALSTNSSNAKSGRNIFVTGIGGGVALIVLLFGVAKGCHIYVTSSSQAKIDRAKSLGAKCGALYTDEEGWAKALRILLPPDRSFLDAVIDGAGGDIVDSTWKLLKLGGVIVSYGITSMAQPTLPMQVVIKNIELRSNTIGSRREYGEMVRFVREHKIRPVVDRTVTGINNLEAIDGLFQDLREGRQFGKLVVEIETTNEGVQIQSKLCAGSSQVKELFGYRRPITRTHKPLLTHLVLE